MRRKATPKKNQGAEMTQAGSRYQTTKAPKKTEPRTYSWMSVCLFEPESKTI